MNKENNYIFPKKSELKKLTISDISIKFPDLKNINESKSIAIGKWIAHWIVKDLTDGKINENDILPSKAAFAYSLGVSIGTIQNALRYIEDMGYVESKQCIGTLVRDYKKQTSNIRKLTSKKDLAVEAIKRYIISGGYKIGDKLPSSRTISLLIEFSSNTTRTALETLSASGIITHNFKNSREGGWIVNNTNFEIQTTSDKQKSETLVDMVVKDLENYITQNLKVGDRMPAHAQLSASLKASIKTIHDALKVLIDKEIIIARRGRYGSTVVKMPRTGNLGIKPETSIFAPAKDTAFYHYEKTQNQIKKMIANEYNIGDKLPSILELSKSLDLSPNTIRKAFHNLAKEGYLVFSRGRYGGTFVIDIPEIETQTFKWLAVNPQYAKEYSKEV